MASLPLYRETPPPRELAAQAVCVWTLMGSERGGDTDWRVVPDGCIDLIAMGDGPPLIAGPATRAFVVRPMHDQPIVGVRLRPGHGSAIVGVPASELLDQLVLARDAGVWLDGFDPGDPGDRPSRLARAVVDLVRKARGPDRLVLHAVAALAVRPDATVAALARELGISARQLQRRCLAAIGYGPKMLQRVLRLQRAIAAARGADRLGRLAFALGYADQAHMSREIKELAGAAASELAAIPPALQMSDLFKPA